jgi:hypothetical protein
MPFVIANADIPLTPLVDNSLFEIAANRLTTKISARLIFCTPFNLENNSRKLISSVRQACVMGKEIVYQLSDPR